MSQSPTDKESSSSLTRYRKGWNALNRLLHEERSFSGNEKNCAFLSMRNGKFASISSVSGLDFSDDSRAVALCDWDYDGRIDLWTSARTAPRVRLLKNQNSNTGHFLSVQLRGDGAGTNRDAIGARVEVVTESQEKSIKTLHAGDGFLTQSSRWLHFGLGEITTIEEVLVRWPGGKEETFAPVEVDRFYVATQGEGITKWKPPTARSPLVAKTQETPTSSQIARIVPPYRLPLPTIEFESKEGTKRLQIKRPTLVCIWSASCNNCVKELTEWSARKSEFEQKGLDVVAVCADLDASAEQIAEREKLLDKIGFAFQSVSPTDDSMRRIDLFQRALMDLWQTMPVPCSLLLDEFGRVVSIYKGPVATQQIWSDLGLLNANSEEILESALPFAGIWGRNVPQADPFRVSSQMVDHTYVDVATSYLQQYLDAAEKSREKISRTQQADVHFLRAVLLKTKGRFADAIEALESSCTLNPEDFRIRTELAKSYLQRRDFAAAESELMAAVTINPNDTASRRDLGVSMLQQGKLKPATSRFQILISQRPNDALAHFHLATTQRKSGR